MATAVNVALYVPNLIGYVRITLALLAFAAATLYNAPGLFLSAYAVSFILDAADGMAARALGQCSNMGAVLDMLTDRAATAGALVILGHDAALWLRDSASFAWVGHSTPSFAVLVAACLVFLDVASHFARMYSSLFTQRASHKDTSNSLFSLLAVYYSNRQFMGALCLGQEFFYLGLYGAIHYNPTGTPGTALFATIAVCAILCFLKQIVNVQQLIDALYQIARVDAAGKKD